MLRKAVDHYHALLEDDGLRSSTVSQLLSKLDEHDLVFGGRPLSPYLRPHFVLQSDWARVEAVSGTIWAAIQKVKSAAVQNHELLAELGIEGIEKDLVLIEPGYEQVSPTSRLDAFLTDDSLSFVELNGESPAGIAYSDVASEIFAELPVMKEFARSFDFRRLSGRSNLLDVLLGSYKEFARGAMKENPTIAIVDLKGLPTHREFEMFQEFFLSKGLDCVICSPDELEFSGSDLVCDNRKIDIVYKRLLVNEYIPILSEAPALLEAYRAGAVCMVNSFRSKLVHKKAIFGILTDERFSKLFSASETEAITSHIPWTRSFRDGRTTFAGNSIKLVEWVREHRERLVLKPNDDYGGHGISIGWTATEQQWDDAIAQALEQGDYLVQERVKTSRELFPMIDSSGVVTMSEQLVDLDPFLFDGVVGSGFTRLSTTELANVTSGGGMVPTFLLND